MSRINETADCASYVSILTLALVTISIFSSFRTSCKSSRERTLMFSDALSASADCCTASYLTPYRIVSVLWSSLGSLKGVRALILPSSRRASMARRGSWTWTPTISRTSATIFGTWVHTLCMLLTFPYRRLEGIELESWNFHTFIYYVWKVTVYNLNFLAPL